MDLSVMSSLIKLFGLITPAFTFLVILSLGFLLRKILFARLLRWANKTKSPMDDIIIGASRGPFMIWCVMFGIYFAFRTSQLSDNLVYIAGKILLALGIASVTIVLSHIATGMIKAYSGKIESALPVTSLTRNVARIVISLIGILIILNSLGISITPILATLGVGGLAVALALQDTLANFFAGFHIIVTRQIRIGDFIRLESGQEGYVTDINWRTAKIKLPDNNVVLVPNTKLIQSIITNYCLPDKETVFLIKLGVHYNSDLDKVERVTHEVAKEIMINTEGGVPGFEPQVRYQAFSDFSIDLTVVLKAREFSDQYLIRHTFIKRLHKRYAEEGIVIPYPVRAIDYEQEKRG